MSALLPREVSKLVTEYRTADNRKLYVTELKFARDHADTINASVILDQTLTAIRNLK